MTHAHSHVSEDYVSLFTARVSEEQFGGNLNVRLKGQNIFPTAQK